MPTSFLVTKELHHTCYILKIRLPSSVQCHSSLSDSIRDVLTHSYCDTEERFHVDVNWYMLHKNRLRDTVKEYTGWSKI